MMNMNLSEPDTFVPREVMLLMGEVGTGKTTAALSIARAHPDHLFHYLMADRDPSKLYVEFGGRPNNWLEYDTFDFSDASGVIAKLVQQTKTEPLSQWIIVDTIGQMWKAAADQFAFAQHGKTAGELVSERLMTLRKKSENGKITKDDTIYAQSLIAGLQMGEWQIIKQYYQGNIIWPLAKRTRAHVVMLCHPNPIEVFSGKFKRPIANLLEEVRSRFEAIGEVPDTQKDLPKVVDTVINLTVSPENNDRFMYTIKDTGPRVWLNSPTKYTDFWTDYQRLVIDSYVPNPTG